MNPLPDTQLFAEITRYVRFGADDGDSLRHLYPSLQRDLPAIVESFYARVIEHEGARQVFADQAQIDRLKNSLVAWLDRLLTGPWDADYWQDRQRIGAVHVRVGLPQRYMFTAMNLIRLALVEAASRVHGNDKESYQRAQEALNKIMDLELTIMLQSYRDCFVDEVQQLERREQELLRKKLAMSRARYTAVVENAAALVVVIDASYQVALFNRKAAEVTGRDSAEIVGQQCVPTLCHPEDAEAAFRRLNAIFEGGGAPPFSARLVTAAGETRWIRWHPTRLPGSDNPLVCMVGVDTTEERQLEQQNRRAQRLASLGTLAAGLAHEIRNPLNAAGLQLKLLQRRLQRAQEGDVGSALNAATVVEIELDRLSALVHDFLSFARPRPLRLTRGNLCQTIATITDLVAPEAQAADVTLENCADTQQLDTRFDEERIKQVLLNVIRNAVEAAGPGGSVAVYARNRGEFAQIEVVDSGPGIPEDVDIFEPFATSKNTGTGLGLPIVHRIVSDHGGNVTFTREQGKTVCTVTLPLIDTDLAAEEPIARLRPS